MKNLLKVLALTMAIILLAVPLISCSGGSLTGKWVFGGTSYEFKEDNKVSVSLNGLNYEGTYETEGKTLKITVTGLVGDTVTKELTYSIKGKELTLKGDVTFTGTDLEITFAKA